MNQFSEEENKGRYCQFVRTADGTYILKPVKVPAHVKAAREERIRQRRMRRQVEENRRRAQAITGGSLLFMTLTLTVFVLVCCVFLDIKNRTNQHLYSIADLQVRIEQLAEDNETLEKRLLVAEDLDAIEAIASGHLGMQLPESGQVRYYSQSTEDYMFQYNDIVSESMK